MPLCSISPPWLGEGVIQDSTIVRSLFVEVGCITKGRTMKEEAKKSIEAYFRKSDPEG